MINYFRVVFKSGAYITPAWTLPASRFSLGEMSKYELLPVPHGSIRPLSGHIARLYSRPTPICKAHFPWHNCTLTWSFFLRDKVRFQDETSGSYSAPLHIDDLRYCRGILWKLFKSIKLPPTTHLRDFLIYVP